MKVARPDTSRLIDPVKLGKSMGSLGQVCKSPGEVRLFRAAFSLAFYGAVRVGKLVARTKTDHQEGLQLAGQVVP